METALAAGTKTPAEGAVPANNYHKMSLAEFKAMVPAVDVDAVFKELGITSPPKLVVARDPGALKALQKVLAARKIEDIRVLYRAHLLKKSATNLGSAFYGPASDFYRKKSGLQKSPPRDENVVNEIHIRFGQPLSRLYLKAHYTEATRKGVLEMAGRIRTAFRKRLKSNTWLTEETRAKALQKLGRVKIMAGRPDKDSDWIDYSKLKITPDDYLGNAQRATAFALRRKLSKIGKPYVREPFSIPFATMPIAMNAAMHQLETTVYVTAAFTQPPLFDPKRDVASNYGGLGAVLGHELTHGFDSKGRSYDPYGNIRTWWNDKDSAEFLKRAKLVIEQGGTYQVMAGLKLNGRLTLAENMADLGGVAIAYDALQAYMKEHGRPKNINGLTPEQRFFIAWAQVWMTKARPAALRLQVATDPHAVAEYRTFGPLVNMPEFHKAFEIRPGDKMWKAPKDRIRIW